MNIKRKKERKKWKEAFGNGLALKYCRLSIINLFYFIFPSYSLPNLYTLRGEKEENVVLNYVNITFDNFCEIKEIKKRER